MRQCGDPQPAQEYRLRASRSDEPVVRRLLRRAVRRGLDPLFYRLNPRYYFFRARRDWNLRAAVDPLQSTAAFDSDNWEQYWASGDRDFSNLLNLAFSAGLSQTELALEIGCGLGRLTAPMGREFTKVVGVDIAPRMLKLARRYVTQSNIDFALVRSGFELPLKDGVTDLVIAWTVFRHVPKQVFARYLHETCRILKPGGLLLFEAQIRVEGLASEPPPFESYGEREYTRAELESYAGLSGMQWVGEAMGSSITRGTLAVTLAWMR
jgi:SAM-dependent methyltransferase